MKFERSLISVTIILLFLSLSIINVDCRIPSNNEDFTINNLIGIIESIWIVFAEGTTVFCRGAGKGLFIYDCSSPKNPKIIGGNV